MKAITASQVLLVDVFTISIASFVLGNQLQQDTKCLIPITPSEYIDTDYFRYCHDDASGLFKRENNGQLNCDGQDRLKLFDFKAFVPEYPKSTSCSNPLNILRYKFKENTTCLMQEKRNEIMSPFLKAFSGKKVEEVRNSVSDIQASRHYYHRIALDYSCERKDFDFKMDMCKADFKLFYGNVNISLYFNKDTYKQIDEKSSCYCYFKTFNTSRKTIARAFDIRLHNHNQLSLESDKLISNQIYWWQSGVLSDSLTNLKLSGLSPQTLPDSVWMDIYGRNLNISCDTKPLPEKERATNRPQELSKSSSGGIGAIYILIGVLGTIVLIVIIALVIKFFKERSKASKNGNHEREDPDSSKYFLSTYEKEESPSPNDSIEIYTPVIYSVVQKDKSKGKRQDEIYESESDVNQGQNRNSCSSSEQNVCHDAVVHECPQETTCIDGGSVYNHFQDQPDVVPPSATCNIYNTADTGIYSKLQIERQQSKPENTYGCA